MKRTALLAPLCLVVMAFAACESSGTDDPGTGGSGGTGATGGSGGVGGMGGDGGKCPSSPLEGAPITSIVTSEHGQVWPVSEGEGGAGNAGGAGGLGGFAGASSGCTVATNDEDHATYVECHGLAQITRHTEVAFLDAEFADGSSANFVVPGAISLPESGKVVLELVASQARPAPLGPMLVEQTIRARDEDGKLLWLVGEPTAEEREEIFGAPVDKVKSCADTFEDECGTYVTTYFDHVVKSDPEQRIPADEPTTIETDGRSYRVTWFETSQSFTPAVVCGEHPGPAPLNGFSAVLKPE